MPGPYTVGPERYRLYAGAPGAAAPTAASGLQAVPTPSEGSANEAKLWHPANPMFAFGAVALLTIGLMAVSTSGTASLRFGKTVATVTGGAGVGSTK